MGLFVLIYALLYVLLLLLLDEVFISECDHIGHTIHDLLDTLSSLLDLSLTSRLIVHLLLDVVLHSLSILLLSQLRGSHSLLLLLVVVHNHSQGSFTLKLLLLDLLVFLLFDLDGKFHYSSFLLILAVDEIELLLDLSLLKHPVTHTLLLYHFYLLFFLLLLFSFKLLLCLH